MTVYITEDYYTDTYKGKDAGTDFDRLALRASEDVFLACMGNIETVDENIQLATCAQVEWYVINGDSYNDVGQPASESISAYSRSYGSGPTTTSNIAPRALMYLEQTGLMYRGVNLI